MTEHSIKTHTVNNVTVPATYKHLMPRKNKSYEDWKPLIRAYIEKIKDIPTQSKDFNEALQSTSIEVHVNKLIKQGYITKKPIVTGGRRKYLYTWHGQPLPDNQAALTSGFVVTRDLKLPEFKLTIDNLPNLVHKFAKTHPELAGQAHTFVHWLEDHKLEVLAERERLIEEDKENNETTTN